MKQRLAPPWIEFGVEVEPKGKSPAWFRQVHGTTVLNLDGKNAQANPPEADAGFTRDADKAIYVFTADCVPVLLYTLDPEGPVAAIHCGWRGALAGIVAQTLRAWSVPPHEARAVLGPSIGLCCFEVKEDLIEAFTQKNRPITRYIVRRGERWFCDLPRFVVEQEWKSDPLDVDWSLHRCTVCSQPQLPSYRRQGSTDPQLKSWIRRRSQTAG